MRKKSYKMFPFTCTKMSSVFVGLLIIVSVAHFLLFTDAQSLPHIVEVWDGVIISNSSDFNEIKNEDVGQNCSQTFASFADAVTNLTRCTILNARPIRICTACEEESTASKEAYFALSKESDCYKFYFESDGIGITNLMFKQGTDLWLKGNCQDCYSNKNDTKEFFKISKDLDACMKKVNKTVTKEQPDDVCNLCGELFARMNDIYKSFVLRVGSDGYAGICIDVIDQMNITRHIWFKQNCPKFYSDIGYPNIITAVVVGCIPVFFYTLSKSIASIEDVKLVRPKRKSFASLQSESLQAD